MAENEQVLPAVEKTIEVANVGSWQAGLSSAINETFSYKQNSYFYGMLPAYYRDYAWRYIRVACQWLDGYVYTLHNGTGIVSTRIGTKLITGLTKQIVGEKLIFKVNDRDAKDVHEQLHFVSKWSEEQNIIKSVFAGVGFALGIGTSLIKINKTMKGELWWEATRFDRCFYTSSFKNDIVDATFIIKGYEDTNTNATCSFFLVEHRFYKDYPKGLIVKKPDGTFDVKKKVGDRDAMVEYKVIRVNGTMNNNVMPTNVERSNVNWSELPKKIRRAIKDDYAVLEIDTPQLLGLADIGVQPLLNGEIDLSIPTATNFGESMLVGIQDDMITYELASAYLIRDMYLGKGTVYLPKSLSMNDINAGMMGADSTLNAMPKDAVEIIKGVSPEEQQAIVQQFNIRGQEWQQIKENCLKNIAVKWGMSPKILANFLTQGQAAMTATQIDSEDDSCISFIAHTRSYFSNALNKLLATTLAYYGYAVNVTMDFASPTLISKDRIINRAITKLQNGLIDLEDAIREINPDMDEEAIQAQIDKANAARNEMIMNQVNQMNDDGSFGNEVIDIDGTTGQ